MNERDRRTDGQAENTTPVRSPVRPVWRSGDIIRTTNISFDVSVRRDWHVPRRQVFYLSVRSSVIKLVTTILYEQINWCGCTSRPRRNGMKWSRLGTKSSRSHKAEDRFGCLTEASFSTTLGRIGFLNVNSKLASLRWGGTFSDCWCRISYRTDAILHAKRDVRIKPQSSV